MRRVKFRRGHIVHHLLGQCCPAPHYAKVSLWWGPTGLQMWDHRSNAGTRSSGEGTQRTFLATAAAGPDGLVVDAYLHFEGLLYPQALALPQARELSFMCSYIGTKAFQWWSLKVVTYEKVLM